MSIQDLIPIPDADSKPFWEGCREHKLRFQKCPSCGEVRWPPSILCPQCHERDTEWIEASGKGVLYTFTVYHQVFHPAFKGKTPYVVAIVELEEGPMIFSNIVGASPDSLACDMPLEVVWDDVTEDCSLPKFQPR